MKQMISNVNNKYICELEFKYELLNYGGLTLSRRTQGFYKSEK